MEFILVSSSAQRRSEKRIGQDSTAAERAGN